MNTGEKSTRAREEEKSSQRISIETRNEEIVYGQLDCTSILLDHEITVNYTNENNNKMSEDAK